MLFAERGSIVYNCSKCVKSVTEREVRYGVNDEQWDMNVEG